MNSTGCPFCQKNKQFEDNVIIQQRYLFETNHFFAIKDNHPVTEGHSLLISKEHKEDYFSLSNDERLDLNEAILNLKKSIDSEFHDITGFNIGMNCGASAGQTVFHFHLHLIPRRDNDTDFPRGGVRGVIPQKMSY